MLFFFIFSIEVYWLVLCFGHVGLRVLVGGMTVDELSRNMLVHGEDAATVEGAEVLHNRSIVHGNNKEG